MTLSARFPSALLACALAAAFLAGCAGPEYENDAVHKASRFAGLTTTTPKVKDFVETARANAPSSYIPVGVTPEVRAVAPRPVGDLQQFEGGLTTDREASRAFAQRSAPPRRPDTQPPQFPAIPASRRPPEIDALPGEAGTFPVPANRIPRRVQNP